MSVSSPAGRAVQPWSRSGSDGNDQLQPLLRPGAREDLQALTAMHGRCSEETLRRRYHGSMPRLTPRMAAVMLDPADGWSVVAACGRDLLIGIATYAPDREGMYDVGLLVEDRWQRRGMGTQLLRTLARTAYDRGIPALTCATQPDNAYVPRTIRSAGFRPRIRMIDGLAVATFSVGGPPHQPTPTMDL
jgi:GNAT superfamily N-acetyltransferase